MEARLSIRDTNSLHEGSHEQFQLHKLEPLCYNQNTFPRYDELNLRS